MIARLLRIFCCVLLTGGLAIGVEPSDEAASLQVDFDTEVMPVLTRHGCNAGSCHGAAIGRGGFKLSLFGSDAAADHDTITHALAGRRVNLAHPERSLLLRKPSEQSEHEGGYVLPEDSAAFATVTRWIDQGAQRLGLRKLVSLEVSPADQTFRIGQTASLRAVARFSDDTEIDVTDQTVFVADDPDAISIDLKSRQLTVKRRGVYVVIARYLDRVLPMRLLVPLHDQPSGDAMVARNRIDEFVNRQLEQLNLPASAQSDDYEFLRRVSLDLTGRLPTGEEARRFAADSTDEKRARLIDRLLDQPSFADYWAFKWANVLGIDSKQLQPEGAEAYQRWIAQRLRDDAPMDQTARMMLTAVGDSYQDGAVNFSRTGMSPGDLAEHVTRVFMGVRLRCANCHNHPLDHWQQDDYHGLAAIFAKVKRGRVVTISKRGEVTHPVTGQPAIPRIPGLRYLSPEQEGRSEFAGWLTSPETPYLSRVTVNRLWQQLMGRGLVEPVDDIRVTNPATHPRLLDWLAADFAKNGYRLKHTIALICNSAAYQRSSRALPINETDSKFYSHAMPRPLEAEVLADAIGDVTGIPLDFGESLRAVALTDNRMQSASLDVLGRCDRSEGCTSSSRSAATLARSLHLINGPLVNERLTDSKGRLHRLLKQQPDNEKVLTKLYWWTMSRPLSDVESDYWRSQLDRVGDERTEFFEDVFWSLITSKAFASNQ